MTVNFINRTEINFTKNNTFQDVDCSSLIPAGATGAICEADFFAGNLDFSVRPNGSTDVDLSEATFSGSHFWFIVALDENRIFECRAQNHDLAIFIHGYTDNKFVYSINKNYFEILFYNTWIDFNFTGLLPPGIGQIEGAMLQYASSITTPSPWSHRKFGSTDDLRPSGVRGANFQVVGVDGSNKIQGYAGGSSTELRGIVGYVKPGSCLLYTNGIDVTPITTASYVDLPSVGTGKTGVIYQVVTTSGSIFRYNIRKKGDPASRYGYPSFNSAYVIVGCDENGVCEAIIESSNVKIYEMGVFLASPPSSVNINNFLL